MDLNDSLLNTLLVHLPFLVEVTVVKREISAFIVHCFSIAV